MDKKITEFYTIDGDYKAHPWIEADWTNDSGYSDVFH